ncbi:MAG: fasciclin domain-containing protein [Draconibacterium sp.]|nr:fasciclin domain-containing protein [Draconibacterium sp.]
MKIHKTHMLLLAILLSLCAGCEKWNEQDIYKRPAWLPGKLYTTVSLQENLTMFTECLRLTGLDKILDVSGSWSVFAPTDEAMKQFLAEKQYSGISDIPLDELERITEFHIIQNPWSFEQLKKLGVNGWKTGDDNKSNPYAYKRETILKNTAEKYWIKRAKKKDMIVMDSTISDGYKKVYVLSRKYVPIFFDEYLKINGLTSEDYRFYFGRAFEPGNVYYAGAKIIKTDILAENGFVHIIDKVVNPMLNAKELLEKETPGETYKLFMEMIYWYYPNFEPNKEATLNQPKARLGGLVDTLWDLNYASLAFDLHSERIYNFNQTLIRHNGLFVPTDNAFREFIDGTLTAKSGFPHWADQKSLPPDIVKIILTQNFKSSPIYPSTNQYKEIFKKGNRYHQNEESIIRKEFGSNCTFIGLNTYIPDRVFTSVTGPVFCRPNFSIFRRAMLYSGAIDAIANHAGKLYFFPIPDYALMSDSSLIINWINIDEDIFNFQVLNKLTRQVENVGTNTLRNWILNQVGTSTTGVIAGKETIRTLGGNNITWDHTNNTIRGPYPCTAGYKSDMVTTCTPGPLDEPADNGKTWGVNYWFNFTK